LASTARVRFLGRRDDVPALMAGADVFAMPSVFEPFGLVFAEAMAMALPVLALDNGGTVEVVEQGVTGLLSAPGDCDALAANLRLLLRDADTAAAYGKRGRERVERQFTTKRMADDTANVFADVLGRAENGAGRSGTVLGE
jgi:glycosyltransferase involved in cell wall biosynthesis